MNRYQILKITDEKRKEMDDINFKAKEKVDEFQTKLLGSYQLQIDMVTGKCYKVPVNLERWKREHPDLSGKIVEQTNSFARQLDEAIYSIFTQPAQDQSVQTQQFQVDGNTESQNIEMHHSNHQNLSQ